MTRLRAVLVCAALVAAACTGDDDAGPAPTTDPTVPTTAVDRSGIALAGVSGTTTSTIVEVGTASIAGSVQGPGGLLAGATVRIERLVAGREIRSDVLTGPDGRFLLGGVPGGRYRIRAFLPPTHAQLTPVVKFLEDGGAHTFDLVVESQSGVFVRGAVAPQPPLLDEAVNLVVAVSTRSVSADGVVRSTPVVGSAVELTGLGRWVLRDSAAPSTTSTTSSTSTSVLGPSSTTSTTTRRAASATARTDGAGRVRYEMRCEATGPPGLALRLQVTVTPPPDPSGAQGPPEVRTETFALDLPECVDASSLTTTTTEGTTTTASP